VGQSLRSAVTEKVHPEMTHRPLSGGSVGQFAAQRRSEGSFGHVASWVSAGSSLEHSTGNVLCSMSLFIGARAAACVGVPVALLCASVASCQMQRVCGGLASMASKENSTGPFWRVSGSSWGGNGIGDQSLLSAETEKRPREVTHRPAPGGSVGHLR
jgi:hypothetical protein